MKQKIEIIKENEKIIALSKPPGLPTTYRNSEDKGDCAVKRVTEMYPELLNVTGYKPREGGLLYRLDNDTSGLLIFARNEDSFNDLARLQDQEKLLKRYLAVCIPDNVKNPSIELQKFQKTAVKFNKLIAEDKPGDFLNGFGFNNQVDQKVKEFYKVNIPIGHSKKSNKRMIAILGSNYKVKGKPYEAESQARIMEQKDDLVLVEVLIRKAIRHQIRVHLGAVGLPIIGDQLYGKERDSKDRLWLHCESLMN